MFGKFLFFILKFWTCSICKSFNIFTRIDQLFTHVVNVTKNDGGPSCLIIWNFFFKIDLNNLEML